MESLAITLVHHNQTYVIPKEWLHTTFPDSLFASTLELDPTASVLPIERPEVTPDVMQVLMDLSQGHEPTEHHSNLIAADRYLGIPSTLYYADPYYDQIPNRQDGNVPENRKFIKKLIWEDRVWPFVYLIQKGYQPTDDDLLLAASHGSSNIMKMLLADPQIKPNAYSIVSAAAHGDPKTVALLLADKRFDPAFDNNMAIRRAASEGNTDVVALLLADPRVNPTANNNRAIRLATENKHYDVVVLLMSDPRVSKILNLAG